MNQRLSGFAAWQFSNSYATLLYGEGNDGTDATDARYALDSLPASWQKTQDSPAQRHPQGANYAFVEGHVKWIPMDRMQLQSGASPTEAAYTFAPK